ncbi:unnamed protein product [Peronospora destructor]|uniref:Uncharacterized protein n=1 Tax=Peronospora destructor TaxID=86335 RepID=A0AAV0VGC4_9STRA|nr:unnamed protein product [Peronospora destructor]
MNDVQEALTANEPVPVDGVVVNDITLTSLLPRLRKKGYKFSSYAREDHGNALYCVTFCDVLPIYEHMFAAAGGNRLTVYECLENGGLDVIQVYCDGDQEEQYFTAAWTVDVLTGSPLLAAAGFRGHIKVINCITQSVLIVLSGHGNSVNELKFHPVDPSLLFSASKDESIRLWNSLTGVCVAIFAGHMGHRDDVLSLDIHLKGSCFVSSGMDNTVKIWDLEDDVVQTAIKKSYTEPRPKNRPFDTKFIQFPAYCTSKVHADYVDCVRMVGDLILSKSTGNKFGLDSQLEVMAVGNKKGIVSVFDLDAEQERPVCKLTHNSCKNTVRQACFSKSGRTIITCSDDATVWRWDLH